MTDPVKAAYQKGYRSGRLRTEAEVEEARRNWNAEMTEYRLNREALYREVLAAALTGLIASSAQWTMSGKPVKTSDDYVDLAKNMALRAIKTKPDRL